MYIFEGTLLRLALKGIMSKIISRDEGRVRNPKIRTQPYWSEAQRKRIKRTP